MSLLLQCQTIAFRYDSMLEPLFSNLSLSLYAGDRVGLLGVNGSGKSTLISILLGALEANDGHIIRSGQLAVLHQEDELNLGSTVLDALLVHHLDLVELYKEMIGLEAAGLPDPMRYADVVASFTDLGGFDLLAQLETELSMLGFEADVLSREAKSLSGGQRQLLKLVSLFLQNADVLILDEPTNYLDEQATAFLIEKLKQFTGAYLVVSHDRWFLDETVTKILELEHRSSSEYRGNYSVFRETKDNLFRARVRKKDKLETEISKLQEVERTYKVWGARKEKEKRGAADKGFIGARAAKLRKRGILAKERMGERIEDLKEAKPWVDKHYAIAFEETSLPSGICLIARDLSFSYNTEIVLEHCSLTLSWGERLALNGQNGSGKSTLIKLLLGQLEPDLGEIVWSKGTKLAYLPQIWREPKAAKNPAELFRDDDLTKARIMLGALRVKGDLIYSPFDALSEGQKRKVQLVHVMLDKPNVLILDEPTTHLDYESVEMLEDALLDYEGTVILVSHDKYLRERVCTRQLHL